MKLNLDKNKNYYIITDDATVQTKVLQRLEQNGYFWADMTPATSYVPIKSKMKGDVIFIYPKEGRLAWDKRNQRENEEGKFELNPYDLIKYVIL